MSIVSSNVFNKVDKLQSLQVLRGFAAMLIVIFHSINDIDDFYFSGDKSLSPFIDPHYFIYGIDLFFVISGFIMVYTAYGQVGVSASKSFILRRIIRIVPLYWFFTFLLLVAFMLMQTTLSYLSISSSEFFKSLFFIPYENIDGGFYPFLKVGWTLNYEMYFYIVFALLLLFPVRFFMPILSSFFVITIFAKDIVLPEGVIRSFYGNSIVLNFLFGTWIGYLFKKEFKLPEHSIWLGIFFVVLSVIWVVFAQDISRNFDVGVPRHVLAALTVAFIVLPKNGGGLKFSKLPVFIGDLSYSLYLAHSFSIGAIIAVIGALGWGAIISPWIVFILCIIGAIISGSLSYLLIEKPLLSFAKRLFFNPK